MKVTSFKGDDAKLLDKLILASQIPTATPASLQERTLVPYFDSSDSADSSFAMLQRQPGGRHGAKPLAVPAHGAGLKRHAHERSSAHLSGSPPKKENEVVQAKHQRQRAAKQAASASTTTAGGKGSGSGSDSEMSSAPQQRKARGAKGGAAPQAQAPQQPQGKKQGKQVAAAAAATADMRQLAAASSAAGAALRTPGSGKGAGKGLPLKFAGPAFTNSPMPDSLPIPTSSLLLQEAAEGLRSRLTL